MSVEVFSFRIARANVHPNDVKWMPFWLGEFAAFLHVDASKELVFDEPIVRTFLQCLRDKGVPAWKRLQAVRSIEWYLALVQRSIKLDLHDYKSKLTELAQRERCALSGETADPMPGEGLPGVIDPQEPEPIRALRSRMRILHHPISTEEAYA